MRLREVGLRPSDDGDAIVCLAASRVFPEPSVGFRRAADPIPLGFLRGEEGKFDEKRKRKPLELGR